MHLESIFALHRAEIDRGLLLAAIVALLATAPASAFAQQTEPAPTEPPRPAKPVVSEGVVQCVVFAGRGMKLIAGATVTIDGGASGTTDSHGSVFLRAQAGTHRIRVAIPVASLPAPAEGTAGEAIAEIPDVPVVAADVTRALVTASADGKQISFDVRAPPPPPSAPQIPAGEAPQAEQPAATPGAAGATGTISGHITSTAGGPVVGAKIIVLSTDAETQTDQGGHFTLTLPEGDYTISIVHVDFIGQTFEGVTVASGQDNPISAQLTPAPADMEDYVVKGTRIRGTVATMMEERRESAAVTDAIGVEDIRKSPDGTASAATRRVVGATVVGGQYLFVRGLGGRYSNVRLNGVPLPSTDPDLPGFQLDLFPASLLSSLTIAKTFTPDIPGDFAGGSMNIVTRDFPPRFDLSASLSIGSDTKTIGRKAPSYAGGKTDFLGFDDGTRALPKEVPDAQVEAARRDPKGLSEDQVNAIGRAFPDRWQLRPTTAWPNITLGVSLGDTTSIAGHRFGYLATLGYRYTWNRFDETITNVGLMDDPKDKDKKIPFAREKLNRELGVESAQIGVLGTASYELTNGHDLTAVTLVTQTADDKTGLVTGFSNLENKDIRRTQFVFVERQLLFNQLLGKHDFKSLLLDWQLNMASISRDQPDTRNLMYAPPMPGADFEYVAENSERVYTKLGQDDFGGGANITIPIDEVKLKAGYLGRFSNQDFTARRFRYKFDSSDQSDRALAPEVLFAPSNSGRLWLLDDKTLDTDGYTADQKLHAAYGLGDVPVTDWLRLTGGARLESFKQKIDPDPPFPIPDSRAEKLKHVSRDDLDVLPSASAIFALNDSMSVRLAYGGTVARPLVRELSPVLYQDFVRRRTITGQPDLKRTYIQNFDARWEAFPSKTEVLAASVFYKIFADPIETSVQDGDGNLSYQNIDKAQSYGFELEARTTLGRIAEDLEDFVIQGNFALIRSRVTMSEEQQMKATSKQRPMAGQSPYVANLSLGYSPAATNLSLNLFYNVFGPRIVEVGTLGIPDVYERPFHSVDFTASYQLDEHWTLGASATDLLFQEIVLKQSKFDFSRINKGATFALRLGFVN